MKVLMGSPGGQERVILCVSRRGYYLSVRVHNRYRRMYGTWLGGPL
jgi:hypothetical protein